MKIKLEVTWKNEKSVCNGEKSHSRSAYKCLCGQDFCADCGNIGYNRYFHWAECPHCGREYRGENGIHSKYTDISSSAFWRMSKIIGTARNCDLICINSGAEYVVIENNQIITRSDDLVSDNPIFP